MIQQWYLEMPDKLSKLLAARKAAGKPIKSDAEREQLERQHEIEFLRTQGNYTDEVRAHMYSGRRPDSGGSIACTVAAEHA